MSSRIRTRSLHALQTALAGLALAALGSIIACAGDASDPPDAEFLVATADSTFWIRSGAQGIRIRAVPMTVTRFDGRFHEVFVADLDRSFDDAVFTGERVYVRDLQSNDSTLVYDDTSIVTMAARHARAFPEATPLGADEDTPQDPRISAYGETDVVEVRGPYALLEHRTTYQMNAGSQHDTVRAAVDLRSGSAATQAAMSRDSVRDDSNVARFTPHSWVRNGYTLNVRSDGDGSVLLSLHDSHQHTWPLVTVSEHPRVYWLDQPPIDSAARRALRRAFNSAAAYDESVKYVRFIRPMPKAPASHVARRA